MCTVISVKRVKGVGSKRVNSYEVISLCNEKSASKLRRHRQDCFSNTSFLQGSSLMLHCLLLLDTAALFSYYRKHLYLFLLALLLFLDRY